MTTKTICGPNCKCSKHTDTPRTDAEIFEIQDCNGQLRKIVTPMYARQLERELAEYITENIRLWKIADAQMELEAEVERLMSRINRINNDNFNLANALSKAEAESESRRVSLVAMIAANNKAEAEVEELTNINLALSKIIEGARNDIASTNAALDQMTHDAIATARDRDEWMTRALVAGSKEGK